MACGSSDGDISILTCHGMLPLFLFFSFYSGRSQGVCMCAPAFCYQGILHGTSLRVTTTRSLHACTLLLDRHYHTLSLNHNVTHTTTCGQAYSPNTQYHPLSFIVIHFHTLTHTIHLLALSDTRTVSHSVITLTLTHYHTHYHPLSPTITLLHTLSHTAITHCYHTLHHTASRLCYHTLLFHTTYYFTHSRIHHSISAEGQWDYTTISGAHLTGVTALSWAPAAAAGAALQVRTKRRTCCFLLAVMF